MKEVFIIDAVRTPIGKYAGALSSVRADELGALPIRALLQRNTGIPGAEIEDVILGCANQAGEDNRNIARMALLLAGLPPSVPGMTVNRLCASGLSAVLDAARAIMTGEGDLFIAGGVEQMSRAPFVLSKSIKPFDRSAELFDTTIGWRFVNPTFQKVWGTDSMGETAENLRDAFPISREHQDAFAMWSQSKAAAAISRGRFAQEIVPVEIPAKKGSTTIVDVDEFPRPDTTLEALASLSAAFRPGGTVTAGNASGINDGACALLLASKDAVSRYKLQPLARIVASAVAGVEPRLMGLGPVPASEKVLRRAGLSLDKIDVIEINEAFAVQVLVCLRKLGIKDQDARVNPNGGAIALGHPLGMSGARLVGTAMYELTEKRKQFALCTMCVGVGQGAAAIIERV